MVLPVSFFWRRWVVVGWLIAGGLALAVPGQSLAARCGGGVACRCGDTVDRSVTLTEDLGACGTLGLGVGGGARGAAVTINCNGFRIFTNLSGSTVGIDNNCVDGCRANVTVKNCTLEGFATGINIGQSSGWTVQDNTIIGRLQGATVVPLRTGITGASSKSLQILGNDILEATDFGIALNAGGSSSLTGSGNAIAGNRITVYELTSGSSSVDGAIVLKGARGDVRNPILIHSNYLDCPSVWPWTSCNKKDLWFEGGATGVQVYNNVFSGSGVGFSLGPRRSDVDFCPPRPNASQYNIFSSSASPPRSIRCQKACVARPTTATVTVSENTCFIPSTDKARYFDPRGPGPLPPAVVFAADDVILDCNTNVWQDTLQLSRDIPKASAVTAVGIEVDGRRRGTIVDCKVKEFGTGIRLKNSQDFLLRWNTVMTVRDPKFGFFYDIRSDRLGQPGFLSGVNPLDFRHQIYNPAYRPSSASPQSFNWVGIGGDYPVRQVLYFYGPAADGVTVDGDNRYLSGIGHLTVANVQRVTVRDYQPGGRAGISGFDPVKLACVGMVTNGKCDTPLEGVSARDATPLGLVDNVGVADARVGVYVLNSGRIAVQNSQANNTTYGLLLMNAASTTIGCATAACNRWTANDEGVRVERYGSVFPATRVLLWHNTVDASKNGGVLVYNTNHVTLQNNIVTDAGLRGDPAALGVLLAGVQDGTVSGNKVTRSRGDNLALVSSGGVAATRNFIAKNTFSHSVNGRGVYLNNTVVPAGENFFGWKRDDSTPCPTAAPYLNSPCAAGELTWPKLSPGEFNNTVENNARGGLALFHGRGDIVYRNEVKNNGRDGSGRVVMGSSDGLQLTGETALEVHDNKIVGNSGWGTYAVDAAAANLTGNALEKNDGGGLSFSGQDRAPIPLGSEIRSNAVLNNGGPGLQFLFARGANVFGNTVRFNAAPGVMIGNSQALALQNNTITADAYPASWPYLTVAALSGLARVQGFVAIPPVDWFQHTIFQSNTAGPAGGERPVYYYAGNQEFLADNTTRTLPDAAHRIVEKVCTTGGSIGHLCQRPEDCGGGRCEKIQTYHLQIANSSQFTVRNLEALNPLTNADPLDLAYVSESSLSTLTLNNCLGPCLRLFQSAPIGSGARAKNTLDNLTITDPMGDGIQVVQSTETNLTDLNVTPGSGAIEGDAVHLEAAPTITVACENCASNKNTLTRAVDPLNRFWELKLEPGSGGEFYGSTFTNRGAFEVRCQPGRDNCCNAADDTPDRCDPDCGLKSDGRPQDPDCRSCTNAAGNCCVAAIDGACDADCPDFIDPDCWTRANGVPDETCTNNGRVPDLVCDYDCNSIDDPDCRPRPCSNGADGCCNASADTPGACDPDCSFDLSSARNVDPDCTGSGRGSNNGCNPAGTDGCDLDCPAGLDPDCGVNTSGVACNPPAAGCVANDRGLPTADDRCTGRAVSDGRCDPDCAFGAGGGLGAADPDCGIPRGASLCTFRPAFVPSNRFSSDGACPASPADDDVCDRDCIAAGTDSDCTELDCCLPVVDGSCDADCPFGVDPDCAVQAAWPPRSGCQSWRDGACDYDCPAGQDPDCPAPAAARTSCAGNPAGCCQAVRDFMCDPDCGTIKGMAVDPDCGSVCTTGADGCCLPTKDNVIPGICDPDCGLNPDRTPQDPDCRPRPCTNAAGDCCVADPDLVCDLDCPGGADPDCSVQGQWCGDRTFVQGNEWPRGYVLPLTDDFNYPNEKGVPNGAGSCIAPIVRFKPAFFVAQEKPPRGYTFAQRNAARGDFKLEAELGDYEGSDLSVGLLFAGEASRWTDPIETSSGGPGWLCGAPKTYSCSGSYFNADTSSAQPIIPADDPLPLPKAFWPGAIYPEPYPSVDNDLPPGPLQARLGVRKKIRSRQWPSRTTGFTDPNFLTGVTAYWESKTSVLADSYGLDGHREPVWLELLASDEAGCTGAVGGGCFSAGPATTVRLSDRHTEPGWTKRQRVMVDLQPPGLPGSVTRRVGPAKTLRPCGKVHRYSLAWDWAIGEFTAADNPQDPSWTPGQAHYEVWYGTNEEEVEDPLKLLCSDATGACGGGRRAGDVCDDGTGRCHVGDGNPANGPFVWEDIPQTDSGLPRETCDWSRLGPKSKFDPDLAQLTCNQARRCSTTLYSKLSGAVSFAVCAVDDFGNRSACLSSVPRPWVQTQYGDVYAGSDLKAKFGAPLPETNATFLITSAGEISDQWTSQSTALGRGVLPGYNPAIPFPTYKNNFTTAAGTLWFLQGFDGTNFVTPDGVIDRLKTRYGENRIVDLGAACTGRASLPPVLDGKMYYFNGDCTILTPTDFVNGRGVQDASGLMLINGNLTLNGDIRYSGPPPGRLKNIASAVWLVLGGVTIDPSVSQVDSSIIALGTAAQSRLACDSPSSDPVRCGTIATGSGAVALRVRGIMMAREFIFSRAYASLDQAAETITYDGRITANPPLGLEDALQSLPVWQP